MKMDTQVTLRISVLGKIWWPMGLVCSLEKTIKLGKNPFQVDINPTVDEVEDWLMTNTGDFSEVMDWDCQMESTTWEGNKRITEFTELKPWNDEEMEYTYLDTISEFVE
jgi:hypothetical protein